jgi:hypothetical protein
MNGAIQLGMIPMAALQHSTEAVGTSPTWHRASKKSLIATVTRIEIAVTCSNKRRKHFLIATRNGCCSAARVKNRVAETAKINRNTQLVESLVSRSIQRIGHPINRHKNPCPRARKWFYYSPHPALQTVGRENEQPQKTAKKTALMRYLEILTRGFAWRLKNRRTLPASS